jgi:hypothetical protein
VSRLFDLSASVSRLSAPSEGVGRWSHGSFVEIF